MILSSPKLRLCAPRQIRRIAPVALVAALAACGGRSGVLDAPAPGQSLTPPAPDAGPPATPDPVPTTPFPSGTIAVCGEAGGITFFPPGATTRTAPLGHLDHAVTSFFAEYMAFDRAGYLYVDGFYDYGATPPPDVSVTRVDVFAPGSVGTAPPVRTIMGPTTGLFDTSAMAIDPAGELLVANLQASSQGLGRGTVSVFAADANGDTAPVRVLYPAGVAIPSGLATDGQGNIFLADSEGGSVKEFAPGTGGNQSPIQTFAGPTPIEDATGLAVDANGSIYVADSPQNRVLIYGAIQANGDASQQILAGDRTELDSPTDVAIDHDGRILVTTQQHGVLIFPAGSSGNVAPVGSLSVDTTTTYGYYVAVAP